MIKAKKGAVEIDGEVREVLADISTITSAAMSAFEMSEVPNPEKLIRKAVDKGFKIDPDKKEVYELKDEETKKALKGLLEMLDKALGG